MQYRSPYPDNLNNDYVARMLVNITQSVQITIAPVQNGFLLGVFPDGYGVDKPPVLCVGAESIETGVREILTTLVSKKLDT